jgi:hypothetical protein
MKPITFARSAASEASIFLCRDTIPSPAIAFEEML